jgi:hypothetical protein
MPQAQIANDGPTADATITTAALHAADQLGVRAPILASIIGVSHAKLSRMKRGEFELKSGTKSFELAVLFISLFRSLDTVVGGDTKVAMKWLVSANHVLDAKPIEKVQTISGLLEVIAYLNARRALA